MWLSRVCRAGVNITAGRRCISVLLRVGALQWVFLFTCVDQATVARHTKPSLYTTATVTVPADATLARAAAPGTSNDAPRNGFDVTDAVFNVRSSIRRLFEHHMIPAEVCDGQDPVRSTLYGRDIEINNAPGGPETLRVTVLTLLTRYSMSVRRSGGCLSTT